MATHALARLGLLPLAAALACSSPADPVGGVDASRPGPDGSMDRVPDAGPSDRVEPQEPGTWLDVTPVPTLPSAGAHFVLVDPVRPSDLYVNIDKQGIWKSTDFGLTWTHTNTGENGEHLDTGRAWSAGIDPNPDRDPSTPPALYFTQGWGNNGVWRSLDGGVNWVNTWNGNIFAEDGVTDVSGFVNGDIGGLIVDPTDGRHLISHLHSLAAEGYNGVFESVDGGETWIDHNRATFTFTAHADYFMMTSSSTWLVVHGLEWPHNELWRTTDRGATWEIIDTDVAIGSVAARVGARQYATGDTLYRTTDDGATWQRVDESLTRVVDAFTSSDRLFVASGDPYNAETWRLHSAPIDDDTTWTEVALPPGMATLRPDDGGWVAGTGIVMKGVATSDGTHTILITSNWNSGIWRYVMP